MYFCIYSSEKKKNSASKPRLSLFYLIVDLFCYTDFLEKYSTSCSHPLLLLTLLPAHLQVVTCDYKHVAHSHLWRAQRLSSFQFYSKRSPTLLFVLSPQRSVLPCLLILLHQLTLEVKQAFECSFCITLCVTGETVV